ncbi:hypothetical protein [Yinghuangia sp. YIM S09857]|uniref:hypothetical protein n=1 Tax=Yinghuangia sp. YIM S09857 TaxID=3436929 RepID=UPI003F52FB56
MILVAWGDTTVNAVAAMVRGGKLAEDCRYKTVAAVASVAGVMSRALLFDNIAAGYVRREVDFPYAAYPFGDMPRVADHRTGFVRVPATHMDRTRPGATCRPRGAVCQVPDPGGAMTEYREYLVTRESALQRVQEAQERYDADRVRRGLPDPPKLHVEPPRVALTSRGTHTE